MRVARQRIFEVVRPERFLINRAPRETGVAIVENGTVQELHFERGLERAAFLHIVWGRAACSRS
jgi:hypothetical protein